MLKNLYGEKRVARSQAELDQAVLQHERFAKSLGGGARAQLALTDLSGLNLARRTLSEADFAGAALVGASLFRSNLLRASFYCADLRHCDLRHANLRYADLRGASLKGANLSSAQMDNADLRVAMMMYVSAGGKMVVSHDAAGEPYGVDFSNCSMKNVSFGNARLEGANFSGAMLHGANFRGARLSNVRFDGAVLTGVNLKELAVPPEALKGCITDVTAHAKDRLEVLRSRLDVHQDWIASDGKDGAQCMLDGEDLRPLQPLLAGRALTALSARNVIAIGVNFSGCQLQAASFDGADLRDADFSGADLRGASFKGSKLSYARFNKADLRSLALEGGRTRATDLNGAIGAADQFATAILDGVLSELGLVPSLAA